MRCFSDCHGRVWTVKIDVAAISRVRAMCRVDLYAIVGPEREGGGKALLTKLADDPVLLTDVIYAVCRPECDMHKVPPGNFAMAMNGDTVEEATRALLEELVLFSPERNRQLLRIMLKAALNEVQSIPDGRTEQGAPRNSSGNARESAASTRAPSRCGN